MKITKIQEEELYEARELQKKCVDLHLPSPPVVCWNATISNKHGVEKEQIFAKANSYVRNALNYLSRFVGMCSTANINNSSFKDGLINLKGSNGTIQGFSSSNTSPTFIISLGDNISPEPEHLDFFKIATLTGQWNNGGMMVYTDFDQTSRKLITQYVMIAVNISQSETQYITEASISNTAGVLMLRDVFAPIAVGPGETIRFVYQTEVLYPL